MVDVKRKDWLQALRGVFTRKYWQQKSEPGACYGWYLRKVQQAVNTAREATGHSQVGPDCLCSSVPFRPLQLLYLPWLLALLA